MDVEAVMRQFYRLKGFTLIELVVVISIIAMLMGILLPSLGRAKFLGRRIVCQSNLRGLVVGNIGYSSDNDGYYVRGASDMVHPDLSRRNLSRWHGVRDTIDEAFDPSEGDLRGYVGKKGIKECPQRVNFISDEKWASNFERGCGGYGYNAVYVGSRIWDSGSGHEGWSGSSRDVEVSDASGTLMFSDTAMAMESGGVIEYSFAEPVYFVSEGKVMREWGYASPSIHFRHGDRANIGWVDGHVNTMEIFNVREKNAYGADSALMKLGWFEPLDNSLFDLQ
jgi:prepilin-type N-terminal cleavage/methylation domain-containing protein/prepilin-type processing-associated H-X9-DG protein